jgi:hypothetical protein
LPSSLLAAALDDPGRLGSPALLSFFGHGTDIFIALASGDEPSVLEIRHSVGFAQPSALGLDQVKATFAKLSAAKNCVLFMWVAGELIDEIKDPAHLG